MEHNRKMVLIPESEVAANVPPLKPPTGKTEIKTTDSNQANKSDATSLLLERLEKLAQNVEKNNRLIYANTLIKEYKANKQRKKSKTVKNKTKKQKGGSTCKKPLRWMKL